METEEEITEETTEEEDEEEEDENMKLEEDDDEKSSRRTGTLFGWLAQSVVSAASRRRAHRAMRDAPVEDETDAASIVSDFWGRAVTRRVSMGQRRGLVAACGVPAVPPDDADRALADDAEEDEHTLRAQRQPHAHRPLAVARRGGCSLLLSLRRSAE